MTGILALLALIGVLVGFLFLRAYMVDVLPPTFSHIASTEAPTAAEINAGHDLTEQVHVRGVFSLWDPDLLDELIPGRQGVLMIGDEEIPVRVGELVPSDDGGDVARFRIGFEETLP